MSENGQLNIQEYILCSAVKYNNGIVAGYRHSDCCNTIKSILNGDMPKFVLQDDRSNQGFLTSENRFVDRKEAWKIAKKTNQIVFGYEASYNGEESILISENLY